MAPSRLSYLSPPNWHKCWLLNGGKLVAIDYDPIGNGDAFIISYGDEGNPSKHIVKAPVALLLRQDAKGLVVSISIKNAEDTITVNF